MPKAFSIPKFPLNLPWFLWDIDNSALITSQFIPGDITDTKNIVLAEQPIPGLNYSPINSGGMGNRKISMTIPLIKRDSVTGNVLLLKQFDNLRQPSAGLKNILRKSSQFMPNPKVLYKWGTGSIPLIYYVAKCDFTHKQHWINSCGEPQYSEIQIELILDEQDPLNRGEEIFRQLASLAGSTQGTIDLLQSKLNRKTF